jgi:ABC-2 type transport system ATP-binding protein
VIEARGLVKRYRSTLAVDSLSFDVRPGTVTGFLGPNGAGKSTTMRMIVGLDWPDAGQIRIGGKRYGELRWPLREVGALLEAREFHPGRTARAHLAALAASNAIGRRRLLAQTTVARLSARSGSLEEAFFQLTGGVTDYRGSLS